MKIKEQIPNFLTLLNLLSGCIAIVFAFDGQLIAASWLIGIAAVFDFFDGFVARLLKVSSPIGKELDSLADVVSFGVVPGVIMYNLILQSSNVPLVEVLKINIVPFVAFLIPMFSAFRLAIFNIDDRQSESFIGLPTPANAILIASFPLIFNQESILTGINISFISDVFNNFYFLLFLTILLSYLLVAELPLMSLKFKTFNWRENRSRYIFIAISLLLLIFFFYMAILFIIITYIIISIVSKPNRTN